MGGYDSQKTAIHKPAREVHAPDIVGSPAMRKRGTRGRAAATQLSLDRQTFPVKQLSNRARCGPGNLRIVPIEPGPHLHRSPGPTLTPNLQTSLRNGSWHSFWMGERRPRAVKEPRHALGFVTLQPFVASLPAHTKAPTHRRKRLFSRLNRHHKAHPLVHRTGLRPSHRQGPPRRSVDLLPMSSVYSVTHVAGLDPPCPLAAGERVGVRGLGPIDSL